ncbi:MAG: T9SS type A sorting domain-containing protein [Candidatus Hatepunaea meridiana]|nr:T9SS type A sorting domain-containing protein [Candidatus Hatepunaea meridiana]
MKRLIVLLIFLMMSSSVFAQQEDLIDLVVEYEDFYKFEAFDLVDTLIYVANHYGLSVWTYNEEIPENSPYEITRYATSGVSEALVVSDTICFLADSYNGLLVLSVADLDDIFEIGQCAEATYGQFIIQRDDILYMACYRAGIRTVDVSDPLDPILLDTYSPHSSEDIRLVDNLLYSISDYYHDVFILDISDPSDIQLLDRYELDNYPNGIEINDDLLYTQVDVSFTILSIADPENIEVVFASNSRYGMGSLMNSIRYFNGYIYMGMACIWDVRDPREAVRLCWGGGYGSAFTELGENVSFVSQSASAMVGRDLMIFDIHNFEEPERLHWHPAAYGLSDVFVQDNYLYVSSRFKYGSKFDIYNIENIFNPIKTGEIDSTIGNDSRLGYDDIFVQGDITVLSEYIGARDSLSIFSLEDIEHPREVSRIGRHSVKDLVIDGDYLYIGCDRVSSGNEGLKVISIEDPTNPRIVWESDADELCAYEVYGVALSDNYAYSVSRSLGGELEQNFRIWDRGDPEDLQLVGSCVVEGFCATIVLSDEYAYVTGIIDRGLLSVVSIADSENPRVVSTTRLPDYGMDCAMLDGYLYISFYHMGFMIFDLNDPEQPDLISHYDTPISTGTYNQIAVVDGYVITSGIIYDCARITGRWNVQLSSESHDFGDVQLDTSAIWELTISNEAQQPVEILEVACDSATFTVDFDDIITIDLDEETTVEVTFAPTEPRPYTSALTIHTERRDLIVQLSGTGVELSASEDDTQLPLEFALYDAYPNPFNSVTTLQYDIRQSTNLQLSVYDLNGRLVETLYNGNIKSGSYSLTWNAGRLPSGLYLVRMKTEEGVWMTKTALVK